MKVIITGGTGFIGTTLVTALVLRGHAVSVIDRAPRLHAQLPGVTYHHADLLIDRLKPEWFGCQDVVVHLAGRSLLGIWTPAYKKSLYESRIVSARHIVDILAHLTEETRPKAIVSANAIGYYGDRGDEVLTENSRPGKDFLAKLCRDWQEVWAPLQKTGTRVVSVRTGIVLDPSGGMLGRLLPIFKWHLGAVLGRGTQWFSWIGLSDLIKVYLLAIEEEGLSGPLNAVAPHPVRNRAFTHELADGLGKKVFLRLPAWGLRIVGSDIAGALLASQRVKPVVLEKFHFEYDTPTVKSVLEINA